MKCYFGMGGIFMFVFLCFQKGKNACTNLQNFGQNSKKKYKKGKKEKCVQYSEAQSSSVYTNTKFSTKGKKDSVKKQDSLLCCTLSWP